MEEITGNYPDHATVEVDEAINSDLVDTRGPEDEPAYADK